jgi:phage terminase large subunit-like protein
VLGWELLPWQRWLYIHALERDPNSGAGPDSFDSYRFTTIVVLVARQSGKTQWLKGLGLWRLFVDGAKQVLISAQNLEFAENTLTQAVDDVKNNPVLNCEFEKFSQTNGKFRLVLSGGREWRAAVSTRRGGRSLSVDLALLDELREHQNWEAWNAIVPTTTARPRSLVVCTSNAGDATSVVLRSLRDGAMQKITTGATADTRTGLFEWSAPDDVDPMDRTYWPMANPAMGYLFDADSMVGRAEAMHDNVAGFRTEHLCQWVDALEPGVIPAEAWSRTTDEESARAADAPVYASLDINFARTKGYVGVAARRPDGRLHVEVIAAERGTDWILPWFEERRDRFAGVVIQARGAPASGYIEPLRDAGITVVELGGSDLTKAYGDAFDAITRGDMMHRSAPVLDAAAESARAKVIGDSWVIDRKNSPVDASPLVACFQAAWAEDSRDPVSIYATDDVLVL